jgi:hypothetical protein
MNRIAVIVGVLILAAIIGVYFYLRQFLRAEKEKTKKNLLESPSPKASLEDLERERKHLESLFADRINFYLVFAAGVLVFLVDKQPTFRSEKAALFTVVTVSFLMLIALTRTLVLVWLVLDELMVAYPDAPYPRYHKALEKEPLNYMLPNANVLLLCLPLAMTLFFGYALYEIW